MSALPDAARDLAEYSRERIQWLSGVRLEQHGVPVKIQELPLAAGEPSRVNHLSWCRWPFVGERDGEQPERL